MLFFRRNERRDEPPEIVGLDGLRPLLDSLFDGSMEGRAARAERQITRIDTGWRAFRVACTAFETVEAEPDLEDLPRSTAEGITAMKSSYSKALIETIDEKAEARSGRTVYESYMSKLEEREHTLKQVLQVNYRFRSVMLAYARHLDAFKSSFSELERGTRELRGELDGGAGSFNEYGRISADISELSACIEDAVALRSSIAEAKAAKAPEADAEPVDLDAVIADDARRMREVESKISDARMRASGLLQPLDRVAKKYDHEAWRKEKLRDYISDTGRIGSDYEGFISMLGDLERAVLEGRLDAKNPPAVAESIDSIRRSDMKAMLDGIALLAEERAAIAEEMRAHKRQADSASAAAEVERERVRRIDRLSHRLSDTEARKLELKGKIESAVRGAYGRRIEISL